MDFYNLVSQYWMPLSAVAALLLILAAWAFVRWQRKPTLRRAMQAVAMDSLTDVLLPDEMGGEIYLQHLLLTAHGLVVLDVKPYEGTVFGADLMNEWTVIYRHRRFTFPNPQETLYDRLAALRQHARDVPVAGHVLFPPQADFSKGRPRDVILPAELEELYQKPDRAETERMLEAYSEAWQEIKTAVRPARALRGRVR